MANYFNIHVAQPLDPHTYASSYNDPVALQTEWDPIGRGGANFCTHRMVISGQRKAAFRPSIGFILFSLIFILAGLGLLFAINFSMAEPMVFLLGLLFAVIGLYILISNSIPYIFDRESGLYYKGFKRPDISSDTASNRYVSLDSIHALQLLRKYVSGRNSYYSYELNLVLHDGKRLPVLCHGSRGKLRKDVSALSEFLDKPVWDAIG